MKIPFRQHHLFQVLKEYQLQDLPLDLLIFQYFRSHPALGSKDRGFISEKIYHLVRWMGLIDHLSERPVTWEKRLQVMENFDPSKYFNNSEIPLHIRLSCPRILFDLLQAAYGEEKTRELCIAFNTQAPTTVRINPLKISREELLKQWQTTYDVSVAEQAPFGIHFNKKISFFGLPEFKDGLFEVQDEGSQLLAELVEAAPGEQVLDYCAGAGGKTLAFAYKLQQKGQIYLHDVRSSALQEAKKRLRRAGIQNIQTLVAESPALSKLKGKMDWILVDAPCTGTGTLRRNPDMKWKFSKEMLDKMTGEQREIFGKALGYLKPGGKIVYATCSLLPQENEEQTAYFLEKHGLERVRADFHTLPFKGGMDGFYGAVLKRSQK